MEYIHGKSVIQIAIADDHTLVRQALTGLINTWEKCVVVTEAWNGQELIDTIDFKNPPDLILLDLAMPVMNGYDTIKALKKFSPALKFLATSLYRSEEATIRLLKVGAQGYVSKNEDGDVLKKAIYDMMRSGYYFSDQAAARLVRQLMHNKDFTLKNEISDEEINFLKYITTEKTYKQIARAMDISNRHAEYLRRNLFDRSEVKNRTSFAVWAIDKGLTV